MAFSNANLGNEGGSNPGSPFNRQSQFRLLNQQAFGVPQGGGAAIPGGGGGGGASIPTLETSTAVNPATFPGASSIAGAGSPVAGAEMAIPWATVAQLAGLGLNFAGGLVGDEVPPQFVNQTGTFAGTGMDPRKLAEIQAGLVGAQGDLINQVTSQPIDLSGTLVQQPPTFTGGVLPFDVGVTGVDPGFANPALVSAPGLDTSSMMEAMDAIKSLGIGNIGTEELAGRASPGERASSRARDFADRSEPVGVAMPKAIATDPFEGSQPGEFNEFQREFIERELERREAADLPTDFVERSVSRRRAQQSERPSGLEVLEQAATEPGKGVRRRRS